LTLKEQGGEPEMNEVGLKIREIRQEKGLTLEEVATRIGKTKSYLSKLERGEKRINLEILQSISKVLDIDVTEIFPNKEKVHNPYTQDEDWAFLIKELKEKGYSAADIYFKIAQESIEKDKNQ
jgi:XRE family transcriptional regulator, master regulator for biofilm formation